MGIRRDGKWGLHLTKNRSAVAQVVADRPGRGDADFAVVVGAQRQRVCLDIDGGHDGAGAVVKAERVVVATDQDQVPGPQIERVVVGAIAGWLAGQIMRGFGFGLIWNIVIGIVGAFIGVWLMMTLSARSSRSSFEKVRPAIRGICIAWK